MIMKVRTIRRTILSKKQVIFEIELSKVLNNKKTDFPTLLESIILKLIFVTISYLKPMFENFEYQIFENVDEHKPTVHFTFTFLFFFMPKFLNQKL